MNFSFFRNDSPRLSKTVSISSKERTFEFKARGSVAVVIENGIDNLFFGSSSGRVLALNLHKAKIKDKRRCDTERKTDLPYRRHPIDHPVSQISVRYFSLPCQVVASDYFLQQHHRIPFE